MISKQRMYELMEFINDDVKPDDVKPPLNDEERDFYETELGWKHYAEKVTGRKLSVDPVNE